MKPSTKVKTFVFLAILLVVISILNIISMDALLQGNYSFFLFILAIVFLGRAIVLYRKE
jgi:hypothetical protein